MGKIIESNGAACGVQLDVGRRRRSQDAGERTSRWSMYPAASAVALRHRHCSTHLAGVSQSVSEVNLEIGYSTMIVRLSPHDLPQWKVAVDWDESALLLD